jgi:hypothetical protein
VRAANHFGPGQLEYACQDGRGRTVKFP